jgi:hypothetical protein
MNILPAYRVYLSTRFVESLLFTSIVTINLVYQVTVVKLNPLQLVLVGTLLETVCFLSEIPTGLLADVHSRKLSTIIGVILLGLGFVIEGSFPTFLFVMLAQIVWGLGATFVSGAREAWITDEVGEPYANKAFMRGEQLAQFGAIIGIEKRTKNGVKYHHKTTLEKFKKIWIISCFMMILDTVCFDKLKANIKSLPTMLDNQACFEMFVKVYKDVYNTSQAGCLKFKETLHEVFFNRDKPNRPKP